MTDLIMMNCPRLWERVMGGSVPAKLAVDQMIGCRLDNYTLIAYKENSTDICRGCVIAQYPSDFILINRLDESRLCASWANILDKNTKLEIGEAEYQIIIMKDQYVLYDTSGEMPDWHYDKDKYASHEESVEACERDRDRVLRLKIIAERIREFRHEIN